MQTFEPVGGRPADAGPRPRAAADQHARRRRGGARRHTPGGTEEESKGAAKSDFDHTEGDVDRGDPDDAARSRVAPRDPRRIAISLTVARDALNNVIDGAYDAKNKAEPVDQAKADQAMTQVGNVVKQTVGWRADRDGDDSYTSVLAAKFDDPKASLEKAGVVVSGSAAAGACGGGPLGMVSGYAKQAAAAIGFLLFLFLVRRSLKKRQALLSSAGRRLAARARGAADQDRGAPARRERPERGRARRRSTRSGCRARSRSSPRSARQEVAMALRGWLGAEPS